jgi:hypothetical protein
MESRRCRKPVRAGRVAGRKGIAFRQNIRRPYARSRHHWSELSDEGKAFIKADYAKWMKSIDRHGTSEAAKAEKLERRWRKFSGER